MKTQTLDILGSIFLLIATSLLLAWALLVAITQQQEFNERIVQSRCEKNYLAGYCDDVAVEPKEVARGL